MRRCTSALPCRLDVDLISEIDNHWVVFEVTFRDACK